ncbi:MAG: hypothetical protein GWN88_21055 [Nitrospinaceae bacterium]|nr:hypothetical protein [Nitrospinaceae bacterium]
MAYVEPDVQVDGEGLYYTGEETEQGYQYPDPTEQYDPMAWMEGLINTIEYYQDQMYGDINFNSLQN